MSCSDFHLTLRSKPELSIIGEASVVCETSFFQPLPHTSKRQITEYDAIIPIVPTRDMLINIGMSPEGHCVFAGYRRLEDGSKGPAEMCQIIRSEGDLIVAVNGISTEGKTYNEVLDMLRESCIGRYSRIRFKGGSEKDGHAASGKLVSSTLPYGLFPLDVQKTELEQTVTELKSQLLDKHTQLQDSQDFACRLKEELLLVQAQAQVLEKSVTALQDDLFCKNSKLLAMGNELAHLKFESAIRHNQVETREAEQSRKLRCSEIQVAEFGKHLVQNPVGPLSDCAVLSPGNLKSAAQILHSLQSPTPPLFTGELQELFTNNVSGNQMVPASEIFNRASPPLFTGELQEPRTNVVSGNQIVPASEIFIRESESTATLHGAAVQFTNADKRPLKKRKMGTTCSSVSANTLTRTAENSETVPGINSMLGTSGKLSGGCKMVKQQEDFVNKPPLVGDLQISRKKRALKRFSEKGGGAVGDVAPPPVHGQCGSKKAGKIEKVQNRRSRIASKPSEQKKKKRAVVTGYLGTNKDTNHNTQPKSGLVTADNSTVEKLHGVAGEQVKNSACLFEGIRTDIDETSVSISSSDSKSSGGKITSSEKRARAKSSITQINSKVSQEECEEHNRSCDAFAKVIRASNQKAIISINSRLLFGLSDSSDDEEKEAGFDAVCKVSAQDQLYRSLATNSCGKATKFVSSRFNTRISQKNRYETLSSNQQGVDYDPPTQKIQREGWYEKSSTTLLPERYPVGTVVKKFFEGHGWFYGRIVEREEDRYKIVYEDGDEEEYLYTESFLLDKIVVQRDTRKTMRKLIENVLASA